MILVKKKYDDGGKFSLKDLLAAYKATKPTKGKYSYEPGELGTLFTAEEDMPSQKSGIIEKGDQYYMELPNLDPEVQERKLRLGLIDKIKERQGGASATGGGGVTVLKGDEYIPFKKKYKGTEGGGTDISYRYGTTNPFKRLKAALQSLRPKETTYANPRFL